MIRPEVSVCIPAYRAGRHLEATMASVLAQTYQDWELVVVDNASPDDTGAIARSFDDPRITVVTNPATVSLQDNWNLAVDHTRGRYVKLLPADDLLHPECLELQVKDFESHPGVAVVACRRDIIDTAGALVIAERGLPDLIGEVPSAEVIRRIVASGINPVGEPASLLFRRDDFEAVGGFDSDLIAVLDLDLVARLLARGHLYGRDRALASFRVSAGSQTARAIHLQVVQHREVLRRLAADRRWSVTRADRIRGLFLTSLAGLERRLLYRAVNSRRPLVARLPGLVLRRR